MIKPLAFVHYENLLPGTQLVTRLEDLGYRVRLVADAESLVRLAEEEKPLVVVTDLASHNADVCAVITRLKKNLATSHIPVLAYTGQANAQLQAAARLAGATLVSGEDAILVQLPHLLQQVLHVE